MVAAPGVAVGRAATPCRRASPRRRCPAARRTQQLTPPAWVGWPSNSQSRPTGGAGQRLDPRPDGHPGHGEAVAMRRLTWTVPNGCGGPLTARSSVPAGWDSRSRSCASSATTTAARSPPWSPTTRSLRCFPCCWSWSPCSGSCSAATPASSSACWAPLWPSSPSSGTRCSATSTGCGATGSAWWLGSWPLRVRPLPDPGRPARDGGYRADPDPAADRWCAGRWCRLAGPAGRWWIPRRPLPAPRQRGLWVVRDRPWPAVLVIPGRAAHPVRRGSQRRGRATALAAQPAAGRRLSVSRAQPGQHRRRLALGDPERGPRGPSQGRAVWLTVARRGDHSGRMEKLSLEALARELMKSANAAPAGRSARTVYGGHEHVLRQTLMALTAGSSMSEHENPGEATMHVLHGRVRLVADTTEWEGRDGDLLIVPQARHTLHALEDAAVLLTVAKLP